ncbi:MAG: hypothetical protein PVH68_02035 [Armatimonadota bacterium]|jgi:hypothetical protein
MDKKKKWQLPVLIVGAVLLAYFGFQTINTFRAAGGKPTTKVAAKPADHVKERLPVSEETPGTVSPAPVAPAPAASGDTTPSEQLAAIELPGGDILRPLNSGGATGTGTMPGTPAAPPSVFDTPEIPPATLVGAPGPSGAPATSAGGATSRVRKRGSGFPIILPERAETEDSYRCVGTITGQRRIAILTDLSASDGPATLFVAEGERIPGAKRLVVARVEPGSVTIKTDVASTTLEVEPETTQAGDTGVPGPAGGAFPWR